MSKHTPGPWKAVYVGCGDWDLTGPVTQEDWTLAAAAPDLFKALQPFILANSSEEFVTLVVRSSDITEARAAIAKATGERA